MGYSENQMKILTPFSLRNMHVCRKALCMQYPRVTIPLGTGTPIKSPNLESVVQLRLFRTVCGRLVNGPRVQRADLSRGLFS